LLEVRRRTAHARRHIRARGQRQFRTFRAFSLSCASPESPGFARPCGPFRVRLSKRSQSGDSQDAAHSKDDAGDHLGVMNDATTCCATALLPGGCSPSLTGRRSRGPRQEPGRRYGAAAAVRLLAQRGRCGLYAKAEAPQEQEHAACEHDPGPAHSSSMRPQAPSTRQSAHGHVGASLAATSGCRSARSIGVLRSVSRSSA
jgi:hypothetical protein